MIVEIIIVVEGFAVFRRVKNRKSMHDFLARGAPRRLFRGAPQRASSNQFAGMQVAKIASRAISMGPRRKNSNSGDFDPAASSQRLSAQPETRLRNSSSGRCRQCIL